MAKADVFLPTGMRDLLPAQMRARHWVIDTVRGVFARYGFDPLETPALERIETLMGKYGEEGDKLIFKVLKRGEGGKQGEVDSALRYDLTVPLARVVAMNPALPLPFKRYQIEPVWRADRPQKGRFRQFHQCDVDIVGSESPLCEAECLAVVHEALRALGFTDFTIRLNDRRILRAMATAIGAADREGPMLTAIDKLDKIGRGGVTEELLGRGFSAAQADALFEMLEGRAPVPGAEAAEAGLVEIRAMAEALGVGAGHIALDRTLARGLDYYTGPVYETVVTKPAIGSISGGGRYDKLIGMFSGKDIPAVGVSLGLERILTVMEELGMLPDTAAAVDVYVTVWDDGQRGAALAAAAAFRAAGLRTELHLGGGKLGKQLQAAERRGARFAAIVGPDEAAAGAVQLKGLADRAQETLPLAAAVEKARAAAAG